MSDGKRLLVVAAGCEALTGLGLVVDPPFVVQLLLGARPSGAGVATSRLAGIALLGLGIACWPDDDVIGHQAPLRAMLVYNMLATLYLFFLGVRAESVGLLLWPAVGAHALLTVWCCTVILRPGSPVGRTA
jgi:hypothetical protein